MKRDMELIRKMVLLIEDHPEARAPGNMEMPGYTEEQINYHSYLLVDAGLAEGVDATDGGDPAACWILFNLTNAGHDFADNARNARVWDAAMADVRQKGFGSVTLDLLDKLLRAQAKKLLGLD